jgi:hypothetical protein
MNWFDRIASQLFCKLLIFIALAFRLQHLAFLHIGLTDFDPA